MMLEIIIIKEMLYINELVLLGKSRPLWKTDFKKKLRLRRENKVKYPKSKYNTAVHVITYTSLEFTGKVKEIVQNY